MTETLMPLRRSDLDAGVRMTRRRRTTKRDWVEPTMASTVKNSPRGLVLNTEKNDDEIQQTRHYPIQVDKRREDVD